MYFLYYIFFIITLLISVACNNYIEMTDSDTDISTLSLTKSVKELATGIPEGTQGLSAGPVRPSEK
jgi:hypothetical protein